MDCLLTGGTILPKEKCVTYIHIDEKDECRNECERGKEFLREHEERLDALKTKGRDFGSKGPTNKGGDMPSRVSKEKICKDCNNPFAPKSNRQKRCLDCAEKHKQAKLSAKSSKSRKVAKVKPPKLTATKPAIVSDFATQIAHTFLTVQSARLLPVLRDIEAKMKELKDMLSIND